MTTHPLYVYVGISIVLLGLMLAITLRHRHIKKRDKLRQCKKCKRKTVRRYQMIYAPEGGNRWWRPCFHWFIFDECLSSDSVCGKVWKVDDGVKRFSLWQLVWRYVINRGQFKTDESLFERAGLIPVAVAPLIERMLTAERQASMKTGGLPHSHITDLTALPPAVHGQKTKTIFSFAHLQRKSPLSR